jgi:ElaB/YqjD/DUF883 family membrane-anchored ribosome-binding protein
MQMVAPAYAGSVWTQILTALVIGLLTAFSFQFLLTSVGIAVGLSVWSLAISDRSATAELDSESPQTSDQKASRGSGSIGTLAGLGILFTVNTVLFAACFLAAKFSQAVDPLSGAIEGVVIWSAYFLLLIWLSSTAMSSVLGAVVGATTGGFRQLISTIGTALSRDEAVELPDEQQLMALQQEMQEMQAVLDPENLRHLIETQLQTIPSDSFPSQNSALALKTVAAEPSEPEPHGLPSAAVVFWQQVTSYLQDASPKELAPKRLDRTLQKIWQETQSDDLAVMSTEIGNGNLYNRDTLQQILDQRDDLSEKKKTRVLNQLEETWADFLDTYELSERDSIAAEESDESDEPDETNQSDNPAQSIAQLTTKLVQSASDANLDQLLTNLPTLLQWLKTTMPAETPSLVPLILSIALDKIRSSLSSTNGNPTAQPHSSNQSSEAGSLIDYVGLRQSLNRLLESSSELAPLSQSLVAQLEAWRDRSLQQVDSIQQAAQDRIDAVKQQTQQQLENTRKAAATAAWWLVVTAATGVLSSALAGALAAGFDLTSFI